MKHITKSRIQKKYIIALVLTASLAVVLAASIIMTSLLSNSSSTAPQPSVVPEVIAGEARQNGMAMAYPGVSTKLQIEFVAIKNSTGDSTREFGLLLMPGESYHTLFYVNSSGERLPYYPEICIEDPSFDYTDLFAVETGDGIGRYSLVDYLCSSIQMPYFDQRVAMDSDPEKRAAQLAEFGLEDGKAKTIAVTYKSDAGDTVNRIIKIGERSVTGTGYYFTVTDNGEERPYVYSSLNNYFGYAESYISEFLRPLLVSDGLAEDNGFGPFLTTGYYQWVGTLHDGGCECDKYSCVCRGECDAQTCVCPDRDECRSTVVTEDSKVIAYTDTVFSVISENSEGDGYDSTGKKLIEINLSDYAEALSELRGKSGFLPNYESRNYERMLKALTGKTIGKQSEDIVLTLYNPEKLIDFADDETVRIDYTVTAVEALITDSGEISEIGVSAGTSYDAIKVTYTASVGGKAQSAQPMHAVIDFTEAKLDASTVLALRGARIGDALNISFGVDYSASNAVQRSSKYVITEIIEIYDSEGRETEKADENSIVGYRYKVLIDGVEAGEATFWLDLSKVTDGQDLKIKKALIGAKIGKVEMEFDEHASYYEYFFDFNTYVISEIDSFVTRELVTAFKFQNSSERDPYYGESLYENLLEDERQLYGLSSGVCETAVKILGGLSDESSSATAAGLSGDEVLEVGLTPDVMKKYGLYAYTVYFELPRGIKAYEPESSDDDTLGEKLDDYSFRSTLGFNLYISEVDNETNTRYIGSDLYDIVTRVPAEDFVFLKYDFESFWARRNIILMDISDISKFGIEFHMSDLKGSYLFELTQPKVEKGALGVYVTAAGECTPNKFTEFVSSSQYADHVYNGGTSLKSLYEYMSDASSETHKSALPDSLGASCFKDAMRMLYFISYVDILSEQERAVAPSEEDLVMSMSLKLVETANASPYTYVYRFYRIDDRRIRVSIHQQTASGVAVSEAVDDFYLSTFAFKKIVNGFVGILNAEVIDIDVGYPDEG